MLFTVQCECGKELRADWAAAGTRLACSCGREVPTPPMTALLGGWEASRRSERSRPGLTATGGAFLALALTALVAGGIAALGLGLDRRVEVRFFGALLGGGLLLLVMTTAAVLRAFGARFFRE